MKHKNACNAGCVQQMAAIELLLSFPKEDELRDRAVNEKS